MIRFVSSILLLVLLAACSGNEVLNNKQAPAEADENGISPLLVPPWETFVKAGPGAENDLDLETLNGPKAAEPADVAEAEPVEPIKPDEPDEPVGPDGSTVPAPQPVKKPQPAKPGQTVIAAVAVPPVQGAKGQGNAELTAAMRSALQKAGWPVLDAPRKDALTVQGSVAIAAAQGDSQSVKIIWDVLSPNGKRLGDLKQDNAVPVGSLDQSWGENATYAAEAAAEGIFELIKKYR